jgi:SNF2 family DNA or RNA helicase
MALVGRRTFLAYESEMNLPEPVVSRRPVELSPEQKRVYNDLKETFLAELASGALVEAPLAISRYQKFQQIIGGHVRVEDGGWEPLPCPRLESAVDVVEAAPSKILVWAEWQPDILQLSAALRKADLPHVTYFGGNTERQNAKNLDHFRDSTDCHAFVATRASGGAGLTINEAKRTLNYTHSYNTEYVWQSRKRNHRLGQDHIIHVTNLYAPGTIDAKILASNAKDEDVASIMRNPALFAQWLTDQTED